MTDLSERISRLSPQRLALLVMDLQSRLDALQRARQEPIAIVGMSCRTPGGVDSPEKFWELLVQGVDAITEVPAERWKLDIPDMLGRKEVGDLRGHWGGFVDGIDRFDPQFFGIVPREAARMDPQQRLLLEVAWEALERAGYAPDGLTGTPTGVFLGLNSSDYSQILLSSGLDGYDIHALMGGMPCIASGRISYLLGLQGPSLSLDTGCSSSLVALHLAVQSLRSGECAMALVGGVNTVLRPGWTVAASRAEILAPDGHCKTFDAAANGYVRSDGCGVVVLKRLSDAIAAGDAIQGVIRGTAVNQDGRSNGLTAPNGPSQTEVIRAAWANGGVDPHDVTYVEAHGTGTPLGDPIEAQALGAALGDARTSEKPVWIGSVKSNIGHLEAAAGVAGLMKLVLSIQHEQIPPSLHFTQPSPHIPWDRLPLQVPTAVVPWDATVGPRMGGVSSFGLSGTNAHVVVEAAPVSEPKRNERERPVQMLTLSAKTETALDALAERYRSHLSTVPATSLADVTYTAGVGRSQFAQRLAVIGSSPDALSAGLETYLQGRSSSSVLRPQSRGAQAPKVAFLFTGLGSQFVGMGRQLYETQPTFRAALEECQEVLRPLLEQPLLSVLYPEPGVTSMLDDRAYGLPVVFAFEYAMAQLWRSWGIEPSCVLGHSLGEYIAACVAGVLSLEDGLRLSAERARLVSTLPRAGEMVSVLASEAQVASIIADYQNDVSIAAINGPESVVVAGESPGFQAVLDRFSAAGLSFRTLAIPFAAHSPLLEPILQPFEQFAGTIRYSPPRLDIVSGRTGRLAGDDDLTNATYWRRHLREPVRFADAVQTLYAQGCRIFIEIGAAPVLLGLGQQSILDPETVWLPSLDPKRPDWERLLESLGTLYTRGVDVDWAGFDRDYARRRVVLPTYPFERERYWIDASDEPRAQARTHDATLHPLLGRRLRSPLVEDHQFESTLSEDWPAFLTDHRIVGQASLPAAAFVEMAIEATTQAYGAAPASVEQLSFQEALFLPEQQERTVQVVLSPQGPKSAELRVYSAAEQQETWQLHATGTVNLGNSQPTNPHLPDLLLDDVQRRCQQEVNGETVYERFADAGIEFGPRFRGLRRLWQGAGEALGQIEAPDDLAGELGSYTVHPSVLDACFHVLEAALPDDRPPLTYLTIAVDRVSVFGKLGRHLWSHAQLRTSGPSLDNGFVCDVRIYDQHLQSVALLEGVLLKGADPAALAPSAGKEFDGFYGVDWQPKPLTTDQSSAAARTSWLILNDNQGVGDCLAALLSARGDHTILVSIGEAFDQIDDRRWQINPGSAEDFQYLVEDIVESLRHVPRIVNLWGLWAEGQDAYSSEDLDTYQILTCGSMLHLTQALARFPTEMVSQVWCVTSGAQPVNTPPTAAGVVQAPAWGLGRVIALEQPHLLTGLIDVDPQAPAEERAEQLLKEIFSTDQEDQVALRRGDRYVARLVRRESPTAQAPVWREDGAYLITGGLGSLGLQVARWMAEQGAQHLVLMGRRGLPDRSTWDALPPDDPRAQQVAAVRAIEALGATVTPASADVADTERMADLFAQFGTSLPPLRGVIHAATSSSGAFGTGSVALTDLSLSDFLDMLRSKVNGTWLLHDLTQSLDLDFFVGFSSTTSLLGSRELGHYAAANAFLDTFAHFRRAGGLPGLTINWGSWETAKTSATDWSEFATRSGMLGLASEQALRALGQVMGTGEPAHLAVARIDWSVLKPTYEARRTRPFLAMVGTATADAKRTRTRKKVDERAELLAILDPLDPAARLTLVTARVAEKVADVMALGSPEGLDPSRSLHEFGLDSLFAVQLRNRLQGDLQIVVPVATIIAGPSVAELASQILEQIETTGEIASRSGTTDREAGPEATNPAVDLAHMSDDDIDLLLSEILATTEHDS